MLQEVKILAWKVFFYERFREAAYIIGLKMYRDRSKRLIGLGQNAYIDKILKILEMENSKRGNIIMQERPNLSKTQGASTPEEVRRMQRVPYALAIGSIITIAMSSIHVEYIDVSEAVMEAVWMRIFIDGIGVVLANKEPMEMLSDNTCVILIANEPRIIKGARHYQKKYHYIRVVIELGEINLIKVHIDDNIDDPFTKPMPLTKHIEHARSIRFRPEEIPTMLPIGVEFELLGKRLRFYKLSFSLMLWYSALRTRFLLMFVGACRWPQVMENMIAKGHVFNDVVSVRFVCTSNLQCLKCRNKLSTKTVPSTHFPFDVVIGDVLYTTEAKVLHANNVVGTGVSTKELITPLKTWKSISPKKGRLFETPGLVESSSPELDLFFDIEEHSEEEGTTEIMTETMEQYMSKYRGSKHENANKHIEKILEIVDLFHIPEILDSKGAIPIETAVDAKVAIQEMAEYSQKWHNGTSSKARSTETSNRLADIQAQLNNLGRETKKVYAAQVGSKLCKGPHYTKDCPLKEEGKTLEEAYYTQFGTPYQHGGQYRAVGSGFYQRNNGNSSYPDRRQTLEESLTKFMAELAKRHEENSNIIKEIRASTDATIRNQGAPINTLEIQIGQMSKVLQERGIRGLPGSTEPNPTDHVKSISTAKADICDTSYRIRTIRRASVSVMPFSTNSNLGLGALAYSRLTIEPADRKFKHPKGIAENVLVRIGKFIFPIDFVILDIPEDDGVPLILGWPFLSTAHAKIDFFKRKITLRVGEEKLVFKSIKPATSIIRRVYMVKEQTGLEFVGEVKDKGDHEGKNLAGTLIDIPIFVGNISIILGFSITDDMDITSGVVFGMPFCKKFVSCQKIMERFTHGDKCGRMDDK
ncbi:DNA-directed DNA polymerase [Tanacetum coccineum]